MGQLFGRVKAILATPQTEWPVIARESAAPAALFASYVAVLALIPAIAVFIGATMIGRYTPIVPGLIGAAIRYLLSFVIVFVVALIVNAFAPTFGTKKSFSDALRLVAYCYTPVWLTGIFLLVPGLSFL